MYKSYTSLLNVFLSILFFDAILDGIAFLISFSDHLLLVYKNTIDFCILIFYPATLQNLFICCSRGYGGSLGFSIYKVMSSVNRHSFIYSFPI